MKRIVTILFCFICLKSFEQSKTVPGYDAAGIPGVKYTFNSLVAKAPLEITTGGGTDTVGCSTCGTGTGSLTGNGTAVRIPVWNSASRITSGLNLNADTTNLRIGFGTTAPTKTITLDSTRSAVTGGIMLYNSTDQTTNFNALHIYSTTGGHYLINEVGGTGACCKSTFIGSTSASFTYNGALNNTAVTATGTVQGATIIGTSDVRLDNSRVITANGPFRLNNFTTYNTSSGQTVNVYVGGTTTQTSTAGMTAFRIGMLYSTQGSGTYNLIEAGSNTNANGTGTQTNVYTLSNAGKETFDATNTAAGTTGAQTINKPSGTVNFAAGATSLVVTNSLVTTSSIVFAVIRTNDATALLKNVVPAAGSFTINLNAAATAETSVGFKIIN